MTILCFLFFILTMLSILGQTFYQGKFNYMCRLAARPSNGSWPVAPWVRRPCSTSPTTGFQCPPGTFCGSDYQFREQILAEHFQQAVRIKELNYGITNYDSFLSSFLTSFQIMQLSDWQDIFYLMRDVYPSQVGYVYVLMVIIICNYFIANMIVASMMHQHVLLT